MKTSIQRLNEFGQSVWLDNISRSIIKNGKINNMIDLGLTGMTSNPTIFEKAISSGKDYDEQILELSKKNLTPFEIYDELTIKDIRDAADIFFPIYKKTNGEDGYVSLEANPNLAYDTQKTVEEVKRLHKKVDRPNVMFKIPATLQGYKAIEILIGEGININVTLIFSLEQYINTVDAYLKGVRSLIKNNRETKTVHSVASIFVSRVDTYVDRLLDDLIDKEKDEALKTKIKSLKGVAARSNGAIIYSKYLDIFFPVDNVNIDKGSVNIQRVLWGSTSTKNPEYSDIKYVTEFMYKNTINTMPEQTFEAFLDHGEIVGIDKPDISTAKRTIEDLKRLGIDINDVCLNLLRDGVLSFQDSFNRLLNTIDKKLTLIKH